MAEPSLLAALGVFCGAGLLEGGSGGLMGGLQIACFSVDFVLVGPSPSPERRAKIQTFSITIVIQVSRITKEVCNGMQRVTV